MSKKLYIIRSPTEMLGSIFNVYPDLDDIMAYEVSMSLIKIGGGDRMDTRGWSLSAATLKELKVRR
jgi:hypothetical protein